jgi:L-ascorbate metabolism protein UlaG (beta-lactamase superfamily)
MKLIAERHPVDVCFIPIGDNFTMGIEDASYAINE